MYRVGHRAPSVEARYLGAVLACGDGAVLSGRAAAYLFGLIKGNPPRPKVTTRRDRRVASVVTRRVRRLHSSDVARYRDIPVMTVARTLLDLAGSTPLDELARCCHEAEVRHRVSAATVYPALARRPNTPGRR